MEIYEKVQANNERTSYRTLQADDKAHKGGSYNAGVRGKYLQEALKIAIDYNISIYNSLFLAQAGNLKAELITSDKRQRDAAGEIGLEAVYIK